MGQYDRLKQKTAHITSEAKKEATHFNEVAQEYTRVEQTYKNVHIILDDIDEQFAKATKLNKTDIVFLFFATALQCVRQYFLTPFRERLSDKEAAKSTIGHGDEHSGRQHRYYNPSLAEIIANPVPFDAIYGAKNFDLGFSGNNHRAKTLGHDPILGWIFGTANIATSTMTVWNFQSYHIKTGVDSLNRGRDQIVNHADTGKIFAVTFDKLLHQGAEGKSIIGASLLKEAIHLKSDVSSKNGLSLPFISSVFSPEAAVKLSEYGLDTANVIDLGKQAAFATLINVLISMIHGLFYDETKDGAKAFYQVRTRKILSYSNLIASVSNIIAVAVTEFVAACTENADLAGKGVKMLDIGGLLVTCYRLISDYKFIKQIKSEFLQNEWYRIVNGSEYQFMTEGN